MKMEGGRIKKWSYRRWRIWTCPESTTSPEHLHSHMPSLHRAGPAPFSLALQSMLNINNKQLADN
ncbi:hypothetical protein OIU77_015068 [Salix suchowensis]|uniref:Uncharacterized protein n=1 Tax=Salix suchowensis TaxID=1278906 RepID=A0ABQ8ZZE2_9ROSI|nr:hypothetical protein OIU77_015068 [Salix suchowensis]